VSGLTDGFTGLHNGEKQTGEHGLLPRIVVIVGGNIEDVEGALGYVCALLSCRRSIPLRAWRIPWMDQGTHWTEGNAALIGTLRFVALETT